eukprot:m.61259 g.61259  ORF g.61259 m.61259 type:complete len:278 (+) comp15755_c0_seq5:384-1217(+)
MDPLSSAETNALRREAVASVTAEGILSAIKRDGKFDALCESIVTEILDKGVISAVENELGSEVNQLLEKIVGADATPTVAALMPRVISFLNTRSHVVNAVTPEIIVELMRGRTVNEKIDIALNGTFAAVEDSVYEAMYERKQAMRAQELTRSSQPSTSIPSQMALQGGTGDDFEDAWEDDAEGVVCSAVCGAWPSAGKNVPCVAPCCDPWIWHWCQCLRVLYAVYHFCLIWVTLVLCCIGNVACSTHHCVPHRWWMQRAGTRRQSHCRCRPSTPCRR